MTEAKKSGSSNRKKRGGGHDLIFYANRRTPEGVSKGAEGKKGGEGTKAGKVTKRRAATASEEKTIASGGWLRVNESGKKPSDKSYMNKKSGVRPQLNRKSRKK